MKLPIKLLLLTTLFYSAILCAQLENKITKATGITNALLLEQNIPGLSITIAKKGVNIWSEGFGYSNLESKKKSIFKFYLI